MRFKKMSQNKVKQGKSSDRERSEAFDAEQVDAFVLNPNCSYELVQRLYTNRAWKITCQAPSLVIFVRSSLGGIDERTKKNRVEQRGVYVGV
jgi:hypothetical protein